MRLLAGRLSWLCVADPDLPHDRAEHARGRRCIASLIAASMDPVGLAGGAPARASTRRAISLIVWNYLPNYICALIAVIPLQDHAPARATTCSGRASWAATGWWS